VIDRNLGADNKALAQRIRAEAAEKYLNILAVEDNNYFPKIEHCPVIFEEFVQRDERDKNEENLVDPDQSDVEYLPYKGIHLIVLVHGF
jgi:hypothetical protein